jgi:hypothetical protein
VTKRTRKWLGAVNAGIAALTVVATYALHDWTWLVTSFFSLIACAIWFSPTPPQGNDLTSHCPGWMSTQLGQRLSTRVPFVRRRWQRNIAAALVAKADRETIYRQYVLLMALNKWMHVRVVGGQYDDAERGQVVAAWCAWRNAGELHHRYREEQAGKRLELPPWLVGMPRTEDLDFGAGTSAPH